MTADDTEPEFDPATWTPDKPWPKGYYKPVPGLIAAIERADRAAGAEGGECPGFRRFLWGLITVVSQLLGFGFVNAGLRGSYGLMHSIARHLTPWPPLLFFALVLPSLLYVGIVAPSRAPFGRAFGFGLLWSLLTLGGVLLMVVLLALRQAVRR